MPSNVSVMTPFVIGVSAEAGPPTGTSRSSVCAVMGAAAAVAVGMMK